MPQSTTPREDKNLVQDDNFDLIIVFVIFNLCIIASILIEQSGALNTIVGLD